MVDKVQENRVRRAAERHGLVLRKSARRDPRAPDFERYKLVKKDDEGRSVFGQGPLGFTATLDEIEAFLGYRQPAGAPAVPQTLQGMLTAWFAENPGRMTDLGIDDPRPPTEAADAILSGDLLGIVIPARKLLETIKPVVDADPTVVGKAIVSLLRTVAGKA